MNMAGTVSSLREYCGTGWSCTAPVPLSVCAEVLLAQTDMPGGLPGTFGTSEPSQALKQCGCTSKHHLHPARPQQELHRSFSQRDTDKDYVCAT